MKARLIALLLACALVLGGCAEDNRSYYERAQLFLGNGDYGTAAELFKALGGYGDSCDYALYAAALQALEEGDLALARTDLALIPDFLDADLCLRYISAQTLAQEGDMAAALAAFRALGSYRDAAEQARGLAAELPAKQLKAVRELLAAGRYDEAEAGIKALGALPEAEQLRQACEEGRRQQAYAAALTLYEAEEWQAALAAFAALGDERDSRARALRCQSELYRAATLAQQEETAAGAEQAMALYAALGEYLDSGERLAALHLRWDTALALLSTAGDSPYVVLGAWPGNEAGEPTPLLWRVLDAGEREATLLCVNVPDAGDYAAATTFSPAFTKAELQAVAQVTLPDLALLSDASALCRAQASAYARAQGARTDAAGNAWYWLAEDSGAGRHAAIHYTGRVLPHGLPDDYPAAGIRPVVVLRLNTGLLTAGSGSAEDPFR